MTETVQLAILGIITIIVKDWLDRKRLAVVAKDTLTVKKDLFESTIKQDERAERRDQQASIQQEKLGVVINKVDEVKTLTDGLTDKLVAKTEIEALARGLLQGKKEGHD